MSNHATSKRMGLLFTLVLTLTISALSVAETKETTASSSTTQSSCATTTDTDLVKEIHEKIKADARFDDQRRHINVRSRGRVVTLRGWVRGSAQVNSLAAFARTTRCVRRVINKLKPRKTIGCGSGTVPCGDICIPRGQACVLMEDS